MTRSNIRKIKPFLTHPETELPSLKDASKNASSQDLASRAENSQFVRLADKKFELTRIKEQLEAELAEIDDALKASLSEGEVISTHHGVGYRLCKATQDIYDQRAIRELSRMKLLPRFVRVSTTRLRELVSEGRLSERKFNALHEAATQREIVTLREIALPAANAS